MKRCPKCGETKPGGMFGKDSSSRDGLYGWCKVCGSAKDAAWYKDNTDTKAVNNAAYREANSGPCQVAGCLACIRGVGGRLSPSTGYRACSGHGPRTKRGKGGLSHDVCGCKGCSFDRSSNNWSTARFLSDVPYRSSTGLLYVVSGFDGANQQLVKVGVGTAKRVHQHLDRGAMPVTTVYGPKLLVWMAEQLILTGTLREEWSRVEPVAPVPFHVGPMSTEIRHHGAMEAILRGIMKLEVEIEAHKAGESWPMKRANRVLEDRSRDLGLTKEDTP